MPHRAAPRQTGLAALTVSADDLSEAVPQHGFDEYYELTITGKSAGAGAAGVGAAGGGAGASAKLHARTLYGVLRGLETFSQLVDFDYSSSVYTVNASSIADAPRFPHRGFMVDTAR